MRWLEMVLVCFPSLFGGRMILQCAAYIKIYIVQMKNVRSLCHRPGTRFADRGLKA